MAATTRRIDDHSGTPFSLGYRPALDGLRAVAIVLVLWHHTRIVMHPRPHRFGDGGAMGVDIFFVLSGFLITSLIVERNRSGEFGLRSFYGRRAARLLPAVLVFLGVHLLLAGALGHGAADELRAVAGAATYTINWLPTFHVPVLQDLGHLWSLAIEEQFYLLWPVALLFLLRRRRRTAVLTLVGLTVVIDLWRAVLLHHYGQGYPVVYERTDTRMDGLLIGALAALALHWGWRPSSLLCRVAGWVGAVAISAHFVLGGLPADRGFNYFRTDRFLYHGGFTLIALAAAGLTLACLGDGAMARFLALSPIARLGRASYSLYLWHPLVFALVVRYFHAPLAAQMAVGWPAAVGIAALSRQFVEKPFLRRVRGNIPRAAEVDTVTINFSAGG